MSRRSKLQALTSFSVTLERTVRYTAEVEVSARDVAHAEALALEIVDAPNAREWREQDVIDQTVKPRPL